MTKYAIPWSGRASMGIGWGLFVGHAGDGEAHAHHAVQVLLAESPQSVWTRPGGQQSYRGVVIGVDIEHKLAPTTESVILLYVEPHSTVGRRLQCSLANGLQVLNVAQIRSARNALGNPPTIASIDRFVAELTGDQGTTGTMLADDPLIQHLIESLPEVLPGNLGAARLARQVNLSESRFLHRFRDHTGLPLRPYLRWRRLLTAMKQVMTGLSLTDAAVSAGFADAAHFTRTFRRHFGLAPKTLLGLHAQR